MKDPNINPYTYKHPSFDKEAKIIQQQQNKASSTSNTGITGINK